MATSLKAEKFPGLAQIAPANIEARSTESALRDEQYAFDLQLLDLKTSSFTAKRNYAPSFWSA